MDATRAGTALAEHHCLFATAIGPCGITWTTYSVTPNQQGYSYVDVNQTLRVVRFRFKEQNATGNFRWRHMEYAFGPGGPLPPPS